MAIVWNMSCKKWILWARDNRLMFFNCNYTNFHDMQSFFVFIVWVINHNQINGMRQFCDRVWNDFLS